MLQTEEEKEGEAARRAVTSLVLGKLAGIIRSVVVGRDGGAHLRERE